MNTDRAENALLVSPGLLLLALAFFLPIARMLGLSVMAEEGGFTLAHFAQFVSEPYYLGVLWRTIRLSFIITLVSALIGFPLAYIMARTGPRARLWLIIVILLPLMTSVVIRTFGWLVILGNGGLLSDLLEILELTDRHAKIDHHRQTGGPRFQRAAFLRQRDHLEGKLGHRRPLFVRGRLWAKRAERQ